VHEPEGFRDFVVLRSPALVRSACLLTGDEGEAEDLVQTALAKAWVRWPRIVRQDAPEVYVRRVMLSTFLTWTRRRWRGEISVATLPERADPRDAFTNADVRRAVYAALRQLPPRQRAVIVLRYFDDLTAAQTADALGCSVGTVKSQCAKALAKLRGCEPLRGTWIGEVSREAG
jgi:RNA polymerase sigma-70 factor (sigma-E family)